MLGTGLVRCTERERENGASGASLLHSCVTGFAGSPDISPELKGLAVDRLSIAAVSVFLFFVLVSCGLWFSFSIFFSCCLYSLPRVASARHCCCCCCVPVVSIEWVYRLRACGLVCLCIRLLLPSFFPLFYYVCGRLAAGRVPVVFALPHCTPCCCLNA